MNKNLLSLSLTLFSMQLRNQPQVCAIPFIPLIIFLFLLLKGKLVFSFHEIHVSLRCE